VGVIDEHQPTNPKSPYGESKLVGEWMLRDLALSDGFRHTSLRYFNVVGSREGGIGDQSPHSLLSLVFGAITRGARPQIFGDDYSTDDGTCVRDYIPVGELADCHVAAAHLLSSGQPLETAYNIGTGTGHSVAAVMAAVQRVTGIAFEPEILPRREGDPAMVVASGELAKRDLGWSPSRDLENMIRSAWDDYRSRGES
jgi:UDP-glucose 4-epimerase